MSEQPTTVDTPQGTEQQPTPAPQQQPSQQPTPHREPGPGREILDALNSLPERLVNALREAAPQSPKPATPPKQQQSASSASTSQSSASSQPAKQNAGTEGHREPGRKTFAEWWFGK